VVHCLDFDVEAHLAQHLRRDQWDPAHDRLVCGLQDDGGCSIVPGVLKHPPCSNRIGRGDEVHPLDCGQDAITGINGKTHPVQIVATRKNLQKLWLVERGHRRLSNFQVVERPFKVVESEPDLKTEWIDLNQLDSAITSEERILFEWWRLDRVHL